MAQSLALHVALVGFLSWLYLVHAQSVSESELPEVPFSLSGNDHEATTSKTVFDNPVIITEHDRLRHGLSLRESNAIGKLGLDFGKTEWNATQAAENAAEFLLKETDISHRLQELFVHTKTGECRSTILEHFGYFLSALGREEAFPFAKFKLANSCPEPVYEDWSNLPEGMHLGLLQNKSYQPPRDEATYIDDPADLKLLYIILAHDNAPAIIRLIQSLQEPYLHASFVVHIDAKEESDDTYQALLHYAPTNQHVYILENPYRSRINWGGFSMVNATLTMMKFAFGLLPSHPEVLDFDKLIHLSHTSYPLASNTEIRHTLGQYPLDANFFQVIMKPHRPPMWNYFVECDDRLHRIHHLPVPSSATAGFELFQSSQWFITGREFAQYMAEAQPGTFIHGFLEYAEHTVVADESFFATVLRNTEFCTKHVNRNYLYLEFDKWESDLPAGQRDARKCMMKDTNHCGRSPMTLKPADAPLLELSDDLFARKFNSESGALKQLIDKWRDEREVEIHDYLFDPEVQPKPRTRGDLALEGHGTLIVAKHTAQDATPLCLGLGDRGNLVKMVPCFHSWVPPNLLGGWESGAVIQQETLANNRWQFSPCTTSAGRLERDSKTGEHSVVLPDDQEWEIIGPRCMLKQMDGTRAGRCWDGETKGKEGGPNSTYVYPCLMGQWRQLVAFGDGRIAPTGSLFTTITERSLDHYKQKGQEKYPYRCLAMKDKSNGSRDANETDFIEISTVPCNLDPEGSSEVIVEWIFVPFILDESDEKTTQPSISTSDDATCLA